MNGFALLWGKILDSSIWVKESKETRLVWITMLAMKDSQGIIQASVIGLADRAKVTLPECKTALKVFLSPDEDDTSGVEEGRRVRVVPGGWQIVNHDLYRFSTHEKREFWRQQKEDQRQKAKDNVEASPRQNPKPERPASGSQDCPPPDAEFKLHCSKIGLPDAEGQRFLDYYESIGWKVGKNKMVSWRSALSGWKSRWEARRSESPSNGQSTHKMTNDEIVAAARG